MCADTATGGSLLLLPGVFHALGGIERFNRNLADVFSDGLPGATRVLALRDRPEQVPASDAAGARWQAFSGRRLAFATCAAAAARHRPARALIAHRHFLILAPMIRALAPKCQCWLILYGVEAWHRLTLVERMAMRSIQRVIAISPHTASRFEAAGYDGRQELVPCSLPRDFQVPKPSPPHFEAPYRMLTVTRLAAADRYKGVDVVLEAMSRLRGGVDQLELDVVGDGDDRNYLEERARQLGLGDTVRFVGAVGDSQRDRLYAQCDLFVLPSTGEGFGIVYLEAQVHAKPVIAADAGGAPFVVRPGVSGFLVPPRQPDALAACIAQLVRDPEGSRRIGASGRELVLREFSFPAFLERIRQLAQADA